jgi:hypothetical protein
LSRVYQKSWKSATHMTTAQKDWIRIFRPIKNKFAPVKTLGTSVAENEDETFYQKKKAESRAVL